MLLLAAVAIAAMPDWVPARWFSKDPITLKLLESTPVNCLLLEKVNWSPEFIRAAAERGIATLGVVTGNAGIAEAKQSGLTGLAVEGSWTGKVDMPVVELANRADVKFDSSAPILATNQGVWPGIHNEQNGTTAAPTSPPWIETNTGFLRYAHVKSHAAFWIANRVPPKTHPLITTYLAAIGDAGMTGARWVVDFDDEFAPGLTKGDPQALKNWALIVQHVKFYEDHKDLRAFSTRSISVAHSKMIINIAPEQLTGNQKEAIKVFTRAGGTVFMGPPGWRLPSQKTEQIVLDKSDLDNPDSIWKDVDTLKSRENLGARLFNVGSMLSNLLESPNGKQVALHLVNYTDYEVADITIKVLGTFRNVTLLRPDAPPRVLEAYEVEEGTGIDVPSLGSLGVLILEP